jgi:hypothetical protein
MKFNTITPLATSFLAIVLSAAATNMAAAQDDAVTEPEQFERPPATQPDDSAASQSEQETPLSDTDCVDLPEGAPVNAQGADPQANSTAQEARAGENQSVAGVANSNAEITRNRDDCLDIRRETRESED